MTSFAVSLSRGRRYLRRRRCALSLHAIERMGKTWTSVLNHVDTLHAADRSERSPSLQTMGAYPSEPLDFGMTASGRMDSGEPESECS
jgi:hypothetical protein